MPVRVPGDGPIPCKLFIVGERPGKEEVRTRYPRAFIGPAGQELWAHLKRVTSITRDECFVTNLVRTYSPKPPTKEEIQRDALTLKGELLRVKPSIIVTIGYHAARYFLPQFEGVNGDFFHGLAFRVSFGKLVPHEATLVPCVHSSAALRQPTRYQYQLQEDLRAVGAVLSGEAPLHDLHQPALWPRGLASTIHQATANHITGHDGIIGLDTEGSITRPWKAECISVAAHDSHASLVHLFDADSTLAAQRLGHLQTALDRASIITAHHLKHDIKVTNALSLTIPPDKWDDTMVMAYILNLPQGLKELSARLLGWQMSEYWDLVRPLDDARVTATLKEHYESEVVRRDRRARDHAAFAARLRQAASRLRSPRQRRKAHAQAKADIAADARRLKDVEKEGSLSTRALSSIKGILEKDAEKSKRDRWESSTFRDGVTLPPQATWKDITPPALRDEYALTDALAHRALHHELWRRIEQEGLSEPYWIDMGVLPFLVRTEEVGMLCDAEALGRLSEQFALEFAEACQQINQLAGREVNPLSGEQVSDCLFEELGVRPTNPTKSRKHYQTGDKYLKARRSEHDIIQLILNARQLNKYKSTYTDKLPGLLQDGRYYPNWKYTRTATGRLAEEIILLIPKHDPMAKVQNRQNRAKAIRNCFSAGPGNVLLASDLAQIELRVMAHVAQDKPFLRAFLAGEDPHAQTGYELLGAPKKKEDQDDSMHRLPSKTMNFGNINGMTEYGMLDQLHEAGQMHWTLDGVRDFRKEWFLVHKGFKKFWDGQIAEGRAQGYVTSMHGRRRYLPGLHSTDERIVAEAERQCLFKIQSSADEISKIWNRRVWVKIIRPYQKRGVYCEPWVREHDATTLEVDRQIGMEVREHMLRLVPQLLGIPTLADSKSDTHWGDMK